MELAQALRRLQADNTSGAMALVEEALHILEAFVSQQPAECAAWREAWADLLGALVAAQPSMALMLNLAQQVLQVSMHPETRHREQIQESLQAFRQELHTSLQRLCQQALAIFPAQATVLSYSNSATVIAVLGYAQAQQRVRRVLVSESRPACDGRQQAVALLQQGIQVEYSVDMALCARLPEADLVLVGADAVFPEGLVNKLGTQTLAQLARLQQVPFYSVCTAHKFLPQAARPLWRLVEQPAAEVWPQAPAGLRIHNAYFDITPLRLCSGVVHEEGVATPATLERLLQQRELSPGLQQLLARQGQEGAKSRG
ncbi:MAG: hypothetical protein AB7N91_01885 [Candidatus Tectimicrobiota bacterium]